MSLASALLNGGLQMEFTPDDFTTTTTIYSRTGVQRKLRVKVHKLTLEARGDIFAVSATQSWGRQEWEVQFGLRTAEARVRLLERGELYIDYYARGPMKRTILTLKPQAHAAFKVWLDSLEERGIQQPAGLSGLSAKKPIPASAVDYALHKLGPKVQRCGITKTALREGMKVELEHHDVTKGAIEKTARIAAAHICERKDYYKRLKKYVEK